MIPPDLDDDEAGYVQAFWDLCRDRIYTAGGAAAIPWTACHTYALHLGLGRYEDLYDDFMHAMRVMDSVYLKEVAEEAERQKRAAERKRR